MTIPDVARRLRAYAAGRPLPCGEALRFPIVDDDDTLLLAFVKMGVSHRHGASPGKSPVRRTRRC